MATDEKICARWATHRWDTLCLHCERQPKMKLAEDLDLATSYSRYIQRTDSESDFRIYEQPFRFNYLVFFFLLAVFVLLFVLLVCGVALSPAQITVTLLERLWLFFALVDWKWLIARTWFSSTVSMIRSSIALLLANWKKKWSRPFSRPIVWSLRNESRNSHMCSEIRFLWADFFFDRNSDSWALLSKSLRFFFDQLNFCCICRQSFPRRSIILPNASTKWSYGDKIISTRLAVYQKTCHNAAMRCIHRPSTHMMCLLFF